MKEVSKLKNTKNIFFPTWLLRGLESPGGGSRVEIIPSETEAVTS